ncbi:hypothetical protein JD844_005601 [Phrynosoma platyrhinos]|uniref:Uncharacterized protein n=1 Tax=Phrynosoma platyrhinos TaxID=52577 RepID=A0ABQ7TND6_PHRPL|nr:hypothetical protein JD844_005601 [Phrynosoma platyrhinos]
MIIGARRPPNDATPQRGIDLENLLQKSLTLPPLRAPSLRICAHLCLGFNLHLPRDLPHLLLRDPRPQYQDRFQLEMCQLRDPCLFSSSRKIVKSLVLKLTTAQEEETDPILRSHLNLVYNTVLCRYLMPVDPETLPLHGTTSHRVQVQVHRAASLQPLTPPPQYQSLQDRPLPDSPRASRSCSLSPQSHGSYEGYEILSNLPESVVYACRPCCGNDKAKWREVLSLELRKSLRQVLQGLMSSKCATSLLQCTQCCPDDKVHLGPCDLRTVNKLFEQGHYSSVHSFNEDMVGVLLWQTEDQQNSLTAKALYIEVLSVVWHRANGEVLQLV